MTSYTAAWVLPIADAPLAGGCVTVEHGRIVAVGHRAGADAVDLGRAAVLPALVNAHTHLELSYLRGRVPRADRFLDWVRVLMATRRDYPDPAAPIIVEAARAALAEARAAGTGLLGEVANTLVTAPLLREARMPAQVFYELIGFTTPDPQGRIDAARERVRQAGVESEDVRVSLAPHAPYSVSRALFAGIRADLDARPGQVSSVHLGESPEEVEFLREGTGGWRALLGEIGAWDPEWQAPGTTPVAYLEGLGFLDSRVLAVHGVQCSGEDLDLIGSLGVTVVSCPRSNRYVGVGAPPIEAFYAMDVNVAFGTDSLASVEDLNLFAELAEARRLAPRVSARALLESATLVGARALGFGDEYGSLEPGKRAALIAVRLPEGVHDVEEYLVSGIQPDAIAWLDSENPKTQIPKPKAQVGPSGW